MDVSSIRCLGINPEVSTRNELFNHPFTAAVVNRKIQNGQGWGEATPQEQIGVMEGILSASRDLSRPLQATLLAIARHESGFNPRAQNPTTTAGGIFQFVDATWRSLMGEGPSRFESSANIQAGVKLLREHLRLLPLSGYEKDPPAVQLYALHHDGPSLKYGGAEIGREKVLPWVRAFEGLIAERSQKLKKCPVGTSEFFGSPAKAAAFGR